MPMYRKIIGLAGVAVASLALIGCVAPAPVVAIPGQGKTYQQFQADDTSCRGVQRPASPGAATGSAPVTTAVEVTPESQSAYLQCMTVHGNAIASVPRAYPYPWYTYGYYYPWLYASAYPF